MYSNSKLYKATRQLLFKYRKQMYSIKSKQQTRTDYENKHHSEILAQLQQQILFPEVRAIQLHQSSSRQPKPVEQFNSQETH